MGMYDTLLQARVGECSKCNTKYVTRAYILEDDSHFTGYEKYACPKCKRDSPIHVREAKGNDLKFAISQLKEHLRVNSNKDLEIVVISSGME